MKDRTPLPELLGELSVLFATDATGVEPKLAEWLPGIPLRFAASVPEAYDAVDATTGVVCVSEDLLDDRMEAFRRDVVARHPSCQFVAIVSASGTTDQVEDYSATLRAPVSKRRLRDTVQRRLTCAAYSMVLHEYYLLNMRAVALSQSADAGESGVPDRITERLHRLRTELERLKTVVSTEDVREISKNLHHRRDYLNQPTKRPEDSRSSKYRPGACPNCNLVWGEDHGNELGRGFDNLGAGVWKCNRCEELIHDLHDSNQGIAKL